MRRWLTVALVLAVVGAVPARAQTTLESAAERARRAWNGHRASDIVGGAERILIQLPGAAPSAPLESGQAAALLETFLSRTEEIETTVRAARPLDGDRRGYVELRRRYRISGTQEVRGQSLLLGYRNRSGIWELSEIRVVE